MQDEKMAKHDNPIIILPYQYSDSASERPVSQYAPQSQARSSSFHHHPAYSYPERAAQALSDH
jgi:hypothetical protein